MTPFLDSLANGIERCELRGKSLLLGVSGGPDSVALLMGMLELRDRFGLKLTVAHLNHSLRDSADADQDWLHALTAEHSIPFVSAKLDVAALAESQNRGFEETARDERYQFLTRTACETGCHSVAVGHNSNDQAETVIHQIIRGTGLGGLSGMPWVRPLGDGVCLARPLLKISRAVIEDWLRSIDRDWRTDVTNSDTKFTRNRIRHELLPLLETDFNPRVQSALCRLAESAGETHSAINAVADRILQTAIADQNASVCRLNSVQLAAWPEPVIRECLRLIWKRQAWPLQKMGYDDWKRLVAIVLDGGRISLPSRIDAQRRNALLVLERLDAV